MRFPHFLANNLTPQFYDRILPLNLTAEFNESDSLKGRLVVCNLTTYRDLIILWLLFERRVSGELFDSCIPLLSTRIYDEHVVISFHQTIWSASSKRLLIRNRIYEIRQGVRLSNCEAIIPSLQ